MINKLDALFPMGRQKLQTAASLRRTNELTARYGLLLSEAEVAVLTEKRFETLSSTGRFEFGQGVLPALIYAFCDSPYLTQQNYVETIAELCELFYHFKNDSLDRISDDELIEHMKTAFDGVCQGSLEYLAGTVLEKLSRAARGCEPEAQEEEAFEPEDE